MKKFRLPVSSRREVLAGALATALLPERPFPGGAGKSAIDRKALVTRHNFQFNALDGVFQLGNGGIVFNCDATGLQSFAGNIMADWGWHWLPLPAPYTRADVPITGTYEHGRLKGPQIWPAKDAKLYHWMRENPHRMNLGRLRFVHAGGHAIAPAGVSAVHRDINIYTGMQRTSFRVAGELVTVESVCHPDLDSLAVNVTSSALAGGRLWITLDFPYPDRRQGPWVGNFNESSRHQTIVLSRSGHGVILQRIADSSRYHVRLTCEHAAAVPAKKPHTWHVVPQAHTGNVSITCEFAPQAENLSKRHISFTHTAMAAAEHWQRFWHGGGAIDLSACTHAAAPELERRIVLAQYQMAVQEAGNMPGAEIGLMGLDQWSSQANMEMAVWHIGHYALWNRWPLAMGELSFYWRIRPVARALARQLDYQGVKWPKRTGTSGRNVPWFGDNILAWQQPHPIFFAELNYRLRPTRSTLELWREMIFNTADYMASFPTWNPKTGCYDLKPVIPACEHGVTSNSVYELAYWRFALFTAQTWRQRLGMPVDPHWAHVLEHLAPLPVYNGVYVISQQWAKQTYTSIRNNHPDMIGVYGMLPLLAGVDPAVAHATVLKTWKTWDWAGRREYGWDLPWMAMAAARVGEPHIAIAALTAPYRGNAFNICGINTGGPCPYIPGDGALLYAAAFMAAGWDGAPPHNAPGFPTDGSWKVKHEGLNRAI
jgi:hypothetical protein